MLGESQGSDSSGGDFSVSGTKRRRLTSRVYRKNEQAISRRQQRDSQAFRVLLMLNGAAVSLWGCCSLFLSIVLCHSMVCDGMVCVCMREVMLRVANKNNKKKINVYKFLFLWLLHLIIKFFKQPSSFFSFFIGYSLFNELYFWSVCTSVAFNDVLRFARAAKVARVLLQGGLKRSQAEWATTNACRPSSFCGKEMAKQRRPKSMRCRGCRPIRKRRQTKWCRAGGACSDESDKGDPTVSNDKRPTSDVADDDDKRRRRQKVNFIEN